MSNKAYTSLIGGGYMLFQIGDTVTRNSYQNDTFFKIIEIKGNVAYLKGINLRLYADSDIQDLVKVEKPDVIDDERITSPLTNSLNLDRSEFFYLPGKVVHFDSDDDFLKRCMNFYKKMNIMAYGLCLKEEDIKTEIEGYLKKLNPDIIVITGHDAY